MGRNNFWMSILIFNQFMNQVFLQFLQYQSMKNTYRISSYNFRRNYSFLNLEIVANSNSCRNISIFYLINWIFDAETILGWKQYEEMVCYWKCFFRDGNFFRFIFLIPHFFYTYIICGKIPCLFVKFADLTSFSNFFFSNSSSY